MAIEVNRRYLTCVARRRWKTEGRGENRVKGLLAHATKDRASDIVELNIAREVADPPANLQF